MASEANVVLVNFAHTERCPIRQEGAAVRILGRFKNIESATEHARQFYQNTVDVLALPLRKWSAVLTKPDVQRELSHLDLLSRRYKERLLAHQEEFRENMSAQRTGDVRQQQPSSAPALELNGLREAPSIGRDAELRLQNVAVISILPDDRFEAPHRQEPALIVWNTFNTEEEARACITDELAVIARDLHLDVVSLYEWLPLTNINPTEIKEEFRDENLNAIISAQKKERTNVEQYKDLCRTVGQEPKITDVSSTVVGTDEIPLPLERQSLSTPNVELIDEDVEMTAVA